MLHSNKLKKSFQQHAVQRIHVRRERSLSHIVMSGLATCISDSSNRLCVGILTFIYMLNALHITSSFMLMQCPILTELFEMVILLLDVSLSKIQIFFFLSYLFNSRHTSIKITFILRIASKSRRRF